MQVDASTRAGLESLLAGLMSVSLEVIAHQEFIDAHPAVLSQRFDTVLLQAVASAHAEGEPFVAVLMERERVLLEYCRGLGTTAGFARARNHPLFGSTGEPGQGS